MFIRHHPWILEYPPPHPGDFFFLEVKKYNSALKY